METSEKTAWMSITINLVLVAIKAAITLISGSLAVKADAIHSLTDVISSAIILIGIKISKRTSRAFPYGLYKVENLVGLGTSVLILLAGYEILKEVFAGPAQSLPKQIPEAVSGICATIVIAMTFSRYELKRGRETGSPSLVADAHHIRTDLFSSLVILTALGGSAMGLALDRYAAVIVVIFIGRSATTIFLDAVRVLLDASLDSASLNKIRELVLADSRVHSINELWARNAGRYKFVELDVTLRVKNLEKGHRVAEELESRIKLEIVHVDRVLIHYQPLQKEQLTYAIPLAEDQRTISDHFGEAPYFLLFTLHAGDGALIDKQVLKNPFLKDEKSKGITVANWLLANGLDVLIARQAQTGKGPNYVLGDAGAETLLTRESEVDKILSAVKADLSAWEGPDVHISRTGGQAADPELQNSKKTPDHLSS
ncbi:MAG: cation diffusion facilitator family transporter [Deltaproteobacteria bacterium]|jgi:cation diffusion facilitator family transporter